MIDSCITKRWFAAKWRKEENENTTSDEVSVVRVFNLQSYDETNVA